MAYATVIPTGNQPKDTESNNDWKVNFADCNEAVEKSGRRVSGERPHTTTPPSRKRKRNSPFTPDEFWQYVDRRGPDECWPWLDTRLARSGYGMFWYPVLQRTLPAHRVAWLITHGPIPKGLELMHKCHNPICQNIERHLVLGTHAENMRDTKARWTPERRAAFGLLMRRVLRGRRRSAVGDGLQESSVSEQLNELGNGQR